MVVLTVVEDVAINHWKLSGNYTTFEIAAKVLASRHQTEHNEICEVIRGR